MARVSLGSVYTIVDYHGRKRGGRRFGGYLPPRSGQWKRIYELNMPPLTMHCTWPLVSRSADVMAGLALAGLAWHMIGVASETPVPGAFVAADGAALVAMSDVEIAEALGLTMQQWRSAVPRLLTRGGCGLLTVRELSIDVEEGDVEAFERARTRQLELPLFFADRCVGAAPLRPDETIRNVTVQNETRRDETKHGPAATATPLKRDASIASALPGQEPGTRTERYTGGEGSDALRRELKASVYAGEQAKGGTVWLELLETLLKPGEANRSDRREWMQAYARCWNAGADRAMRLERLDACVSKAFEIAVDPEARRPAAVFSSWLAEQGLRHVRTTR